MRDREKLYEEEISKRSIRYVYGIIAALIVALMLIGCIDRHEDSFSEIYNIPEYSGSPSYVVNNNTPFFDLEDLELDEFVSFSNMDEKGRCGPAFGNITSDFMPTEERTDISGVKPSGWKQAKYEGIVDDDPPCLFNRCHLIAFCLTGENANANNLITGTHYMNIQGMFEYEKVVAKYLRTFDNHVLYRVTPMYKGKERVPRGVLMEGYSIEDLGEGVCFCVYCYNVQPGVYINYRTGDSKLIAKNNGNRW